MNAPRALPTWSGPVGLAETNSTLTARGLADASRPQRAGSARMPATIRSSAASARRRFRNPGGAAVAPAMVAAGSPAAARSIDVASAVAIASGACRYGRASFMARLVARSPCSGFAGRSTSIATGAPSAGSAGNEPSAMAASQARPISTRARARIEDDGGSRSGSVTARMVAARPLGAPAGDPLGPWYQSGQDPR